jgi:hypothetical protein
MELTTNHRHPPIRIQKNVLAALKEYARRMEKANGTRFSMSAFASSAILKALEPSQQGTPKESPHA